MVGPGMVFRQQHGHYWFIISDPHQNPGMVACVNMTTRRDRPNEDYSCTLHHSDHAAVSHDSYIVYQRMQFFTVAQLHRMLSKNMAEYIPPPCSEALLEKLRKGAVTSRYTPQKCITLLREQGLLP